MIYTIGYTEWYNQWIVEQKESFRKIGKTNEYLGGSAYLDYEAAQAALPNSQYSVYRLDTTLDNVYLHDGEYYIKESCRIYECDI